MLQAFLTLQTEADKQTHIHSVCTILGKTHPCTCWMTIGLVIGVVWVRHRRKCIRNFQENKPSFPVP